MPWPQNYTPLGGVGLSAIVASLPVVVLLALLAIWRVRVHLAALVTLVLAALLAIGVYHMPPVLTVAAAAYGAAFGLFPIGWIVLNAIFIYQLSMDTGGFIQALLIAFSFGAFIEGGAGFGAPIAITGALLIGLGFKPLEAAKLALIGNTAPVAFGSLGIPIVTLARVTGLDLHVLSAMVGRQLPVFSLIIPFWLVAAQTGWRGMLGVWPACLVTGASFACVQFLISNFHGPWLVDLGSSLSSIAALFVLLRFWQPRSVETTQGAPAPAADPTFDPRLPSGLSAVGLAKAEASAKEGTTTIDYRARLRAALPWLLLTVLVFTWGLPAVRGTLDSWFAPKIAVPRLHQGIERMPPVVAAPQVEAAEFNLNLLSATGTALLLAGTVAGFCLGRSPGQLVVLYGRTVARVSISLLTIALMLAIGFTTRYSGADSTMGLAFAATGALFPFFSPLLGWLGVALTGSDTSSNVLFGNLQQVTAQQLGLSPVLAAGANSSGGVMGKMIDAQSIVVAGVATGGRRDSPHAGDILRSVFWHSLALAVLMGLLVLLQARVFPGIVPSG